MDTPPPVPEPPGLPPPLPEPPAPPRFSLGLAAWIAFGVFAVVDIGALFFRTGGFTSTALGQVSAEILVLLILGTLIPLFFWRVCGRSNLARTFAFFCVFALSIATKLTQLRLEQQKQNTAAIAKIQSDAQTYRAEQQRALDQGKPVDPKQGTELLERMSTQLGEASKNSSGLSRDIVDASKAYMDKLLASKRQYDQAIANLHSDTLWDLTRYDAPDKIAEQRQYVHAFQEANTDLASYQDLEGTAYRRELAAHNVPAAQVDKTLNGYRQTAAERLTLMAKIRETDGQFGQVMLDFLDFADSVRGKWHKKEGSEKLVFPDDATLKTYNEILARIKKIGTDQAGYQKQLLEAQPKK